MSKSRARPGRRKEPKITFMQSPLHEGDMTASLISQIRLARIHQIQSTLSYYQEQFKMEWQAVRREMLQGALVEPGPLRAFWKKTKRGKVLVIK